MEIVKRESIGSRGTKRKETPIVETKSNDDLDYAFASPCFARIVVEITFDYHTHTHTHRRACVQTNIKRLTNNRVELFTREDARVKFLDHSREDEVKFHHVKSKKILNDVKARLPRHPTRNYSSCFRRHWSLFSYHGEIISTETQNVDAT